MEAEILETERTRTEVRRIESIVLPNEGDDGVFTQSWYPICLSEELKTGEVQSHGFLDGKVVVYRGEDGVARVMSGYCPHMGGDLGDAKVVGTSIQCPWHKFEFDKGGVCRKTGIGDPAPRAARLFAFPTEEKYGLIWAFNGDTPLFEIPSFPGNKKNLVFVTRAFPVEFGVDPWMLMGQIPDIAHFVTLHNMTLNAPSPWDTVKWTRFSMGYDINVSRNGKVMDVHQEVWGTNMIMVHGELDGRWYGWFSPATLSGHRTTRAYSVYAVEQVTDEAEAKQFIDDVDRFNVEVGSEDAPITQKMHLRLGTLTRSDRLLHQFYTEYIRNYPRAHPAAGLLY